AAPRGDLAVQQGEQPPALALPQDQPVEAGEDGGDGQVLGGEDAQRVPGEPGDGGGLGPGAAHVADGEAPGGRGPAAGAPPALEDVVEVAADLAALARGLVHDRDLQPGDLGDAGRQEAALEGAAHRGLGGEQPRVVDGEGGAAAELLGQLDGAAGEAVAGGAADDDGADAPAAGDPRERVDLVGGGVAGGGPDLRGGGGQPVPGAGRVHRRGRSGVLQQLAEPVGAGLVGVPHVGEPVGPGLGGVVDGAPGGQ